MRRWLCGALTLALVLAGAVVAVAKQDVLVELFYSSVWNDHTARALVRSPITINHGAGDEQSGVVPSNANLSFRNHDGEMNPDNRKGSLFGLIGHNTPIRITVGGDVRFHGQVVSWKPRRALGAVSGTRGDAWVDVRAQGTIQRLGQGPIPLRSALFRSISGVTPDAFTPHDYWPMEDGSESTLIANAIVGGTSGTFTGPVTFSSDGPLGSAPVLRLGDGFRAIFPVASYTDVGRWALSIALNVPSEPASTATLLEVPVGPAPGGTLGSWKLELVPGSPASLNFQAYDTSGVAVPGRVASEPFLGGSVISEDDFFGNWFIFTMGEEEDGADTLAWVGYSDGTTSNSGPHVQIGANIDPATVHQPISGPLVLQANSDLDGMGVGHLSVFVDTAFDFTTWGFFRTRALSGWANETAGDRFERLCVEEDISSMVVGDVDDTQEMGPQSVDTLLNLFAEIARTDAGIIHDTRHELGLTLRTGRSLYNQ